MNSGKFAGILLVLALVPGACSVFAAQSVTESVKDELRAFPPDKGYYSLAHHRLDEMSETDRALVAGKTNEIRESALIYGYDVTAGSWLVEQGVCPQLPDTLLLHYLDRYPDGTQSLFTVLVPRSSGRVRVVPVLHRNAVPFKAAVANPKSYELFNSLVPAETAKQDSVSHGEWLALGVCYAEMVGGRPNVPRDPTVEKATIQATAATISIDVATGRRNIRFPDREADNVVKTWSILLDQQGRVIDAGYEDASTYTARAVQPPAAVAKAMPVVQDTAAKNTTAIPDPPSKILAVVPDPPSRIITNIPDPPVKITPAPNQN